MEQDTVRNRIFIIGNGFDLAHKLPTSYKDFLRWFLSKVIAEVRSDGIHESPLIQISYIASNGNFEPKGLDDSIDWFTYYSNKKSYAEITKQKIKILQNKIYSVPYISELFDNIFDKINWVDIENEYFKLLLDYNKDDVSSKTTSRERIEQLNEEFQYLRDQLIEYLESEIQYPKMDKSFKGIFKSGNYENQLFLTFNYTKMLLPYYIYLFEESSKFTQMIHIHGALSPSSTKTSDYNGIKDYEQNVPIIEEKKLHIDSKRNLTFDTKKFEEIKQLDLSQIEGWNDVSDHLINLRQNYAIEGEPIFGLGDEHHSELAILKDDENLTELYRFSKGHLYFQNNNYRNLKTYINSAEYDIEILGHSCGLSDRTLFKEIFENDNCKNIKVYWYYNKETYENDFFNKTIELSRHFDNPQDLRDKLEPFNSRGKIPSIDDEFSSY